MDGILSVLAASRLFEHIEPENIREMLHCLQARQESFSKGEYIFHAGETTASLGMVLRGKVIIFKDDVWGARNLIGHAGPGQCFAETFASAPGSVMGVSVAADADCTILFLNVQRILTVCPQSCGHHNRLIRNLLTDMAEKNLAFTEKLSHLGKRTTRGKILSYLSAQSQRCRSMEFDIPFSRQQLADYLLVERSGLSAELCKMQKEGLLDFHKNHFILRTDTGNHQD